MDPEWIEWSIEESKKIYKNQYRSTKPEELYYPEPDSELEESES